jgi:hypothetical protein
MKINNRGAASILVVLIIVVLATFGGIALTAGWTNKQLSIKAAQSKADYYALDSAAEELLAETDSHLYEAMKKAKNYLNALNGEDVSVLSEDEILAALFTGDAESIKSVALKTKAINETFKRMYYYECAQSLEDFADEKGLALIYSDGYSAAEDFLNPENEIPQDGDLLIRFTVSEGGDSGQKNLDIEIGVAIPAVQVEITDEENWRTSFEITEKENEARFEIYSWKLWQNPIEYDYEEPKLG